MLKLNNIGAPRGATRNRRRRGRGHASGLGKTSGRGHKGQKSRSGGGVPPWFEGGQMPLNRRVPKRGFTNIFRTVFQIVNLEDLERFDAGTEVDAEVLARAGLIRRPDRPVKLLGKGTIAKNLTVEVTQASKSAVAAIEAAGGSVSVQSPVSDKK
jgi:large subunit ribosomal protein L15